MSKARPRRNSARSADTAPDQYRVGYGRPPKAHQFKPGQSGNPKGRPKGSENLAKIFKRVFSEKVLVHEGSRVRRISAVEAALLRLREQALRGDCRAMAHLIKLLQSAQTAEADALRGACRIHELNEILPLLDDSEIDIIERILVRVERTLDEKREPAKDDAMSCEEAMKLLGYGSPADRSPNRRTPQSRRKG